MWSWKAFQVICKWCMFKSRQTLCLVITAGCTHAFFLPLSSTSLSCLSAQVAVLSPLDVWGVKVYVLPALTVITSRAEGAKLCHSAYRSGILSTAKRTWLVVAILISLWLSMADFGWHFLKWNVHILCNSLKYYLIW